MILIEQWPSSAEALHPIAAEDSFRSRYIEASVKHHIPPLMFTMLLYSDSLDQKELASLSTQLSLEHWLHEIIDFFVKRKKPQMLKGEYFDDADHIPPNDDMGPLGIDEPQAFSRNLSWLRQAHDFAFGAIIEYEGHQWVNGINWERLLDFAKNKDIEFKKSLDKLRTPEVAERLKAFNLMKALGNVSHVKLLVDDWESGNFHPPFSFSRNNLTTTLLGDSDEEDIEFLRRQNLVAVETAPVYWLRLTPEGQTELNRLEKTFNKQEENEQG